MSVSSSKHAFARLVVLLLVASALAANVVHIRAQDKSVINLYSSGDTNITDWLQNEIIPAFEKQYPQYKVNFTNSRASGDQVIIDRAVAAMQSNTDPQVEVMDVDPRDFPDATK